MKSLCWIVILAVCLPLVAGCSGGGGPTAQDTAFEKELAAAAEKNKGAPKMKSKASISDVKAKYDAAQSAPQTGN